MLRRVENLTCIWLGSLAFLVPLFSAMQRGWSHTRVLHLISKQTNFTVVPSLVGTLAGVTNKKRRTTYKGRAVAHTAFKAVHEAMVRQTCPHITVTDFQYPIRCSRFGKTPNPFSFETPRRNIYFSIARRISNSQRQWKGMRETTLFCARPWVYLVARGEESTVTPQSV